MTDRFGSHSDHALPYWYPPTPWALDPDGREIFEFDQLPFMPSLERMVIGENHLEINGWIFPVNRLNQGVLHWLKETILRWLHANDDESHREWLYAMIETMEESILRKD